MEKKKILAVASLGGHWIQLLRITKPMEEKYEVVYVSTHPKCQTMVEGRRLYLMEDYSRWNIWRALPSFFTSLRIIWKEKPSAIMTTGAAPGLMCLLVGKAFGRKTIWIDSIANVRHMSLCGRIASHFASKTYTQWQNLETSKVTYAGNILGN